MSECCRVLRYNMVPALGSLFPFFPPLLCTSQPVPGSRKGGWSCRHACQRGVSWSTSQERVVSRPSLLMSVDLIDRSAIFFVVVQTAIHLRLQRFPTITIEQHQLSFLSADTCRTTAKVFVRCVDRPSGSGGSYRVDSRSKSTADLPYPVHWHQSLGCFEETTRAVQVKNPVLMLSCL